MKIKRQNIKIAEIAKIVWLSFDGAVYSAVEISNLTRAGLSTFANATVKSKSQFFCSFHVFMLSNRTTA